MTGSNQKLPHRYADSLGFLHITNILILLSPGWLEAHGCSADFSKPFVVYTDASLGGLGPVLSQVQGDIERVIAYASWSMSPPERNDQNYSLFEVWQ